MKQYEKNYFLSKFEQLIVAMEYCVLYLMTVDWFMFLNRAVLW